MSNNFNEAKPRTIVFVVLFGLVFVLLPAWLPWLTRVLIAWNVGALGLLALIWLMMLDATIRQMRRRAQRQDVGHTAIFIFVVAAASASILAIGFLLKNTSKGSSDSLLTLHLALSALTIVESWLLTHTMFALRYAHIYYVDDSVTSIIDEVGGLDFPGEKHPDYWDFLYFAYVLGMTFQVSDVRVTSRRIRRLALVHGVLSFFFSTAILALSINLIAGIV